MGSYCQLNVAGFPALEYKNGFDQEIIDLIFQKNEFLVDEKSNTDTGGENPDRSEEPLIFKGFRQTAGVCKARMEIFGMTMAKASKQFSVAKRNSLNEAIYSFAILKVSYRRYLDEIADIIRSNDLEVDNLHTNLRESLITGGLAIYGQSTVCSLYSILSVVPEETVIEYDLTEVIDNGWVNIKDWEKDSTEKIIVLTEGKTDAKFISDTLLKLYPSLHPYYQFIDFDVYKVESNASALVKLVKSFAASKVKHPIIVIFDNDTTGSMEMNMLKNVPMGENFRIIKLPELKIAKRYPTIGPTGMKKMNVNGLACAIEMYMGRDVLTMDGSLIPVYWSSFNDKLQKYQGEILKKKYVQDSYKIKLENGGDFTDFILILKAIFTAFQKKG